MDKAFELTVDSLFHMKSHGTVLAGTIRKGDISVGEKVEIHSPQNSLRVTVEGLELIKTRDLVKSARQGDEIGILTSGFDPEKLIDGIEIIEVDGIKTLKPTQLTVQKSGKAWWKSILKP